MSQIDDIGRLQALASGFIAARCIQVAAEFGLADVVSETLAPVNEAADRIGVSADALSRVLRLLSAHGVFELTGDKVRHSPSSHYLRSDHPQSLRPWIRLIGSRLNWAVFGSFAQIVRTGLPYAPEHDGDETAASVFAQLAADPLEARLYDEGMTSKASADVACLLEACDFSRFSTIADIGGGCGTLLAAILDAAASTRGILFDLPRVIEAAPPRERLEMCAGDFFTDPLPRCDAYILMNVLHDWDDGHALALLRNLRRAAPAGARLLVIESVVAQAEGPDPVLILDVAMLAVSGGRERTLAEYSSLLAATGFALEGRIATARGIDILECRLS